LSRSGIARVGQRKQREVEADSLDECRTLEELERKTPHHPGCRLRTEKVDRANSEQPNVPAIPAQIENPLEPFGHRSRVRRRGRNVDFRRASRIEDTAHVDRSTRLVGARP
jgi:hypothetical protein